MYISQQCEYIDNTQFHSDASNSWRSLGDRKVWFNQSKSINTSGKTKPRTGLSYSMPKYHGRNLSVTALTPSFYTDTHKHTQNGHKKLGNTLLQNPWLSNHCDDWYGT